MGLIAPATPIYRRPHRVRLDGPLGPPIPDGEGGSTQPRGDLHPPMVYAEIHRASAADLERVTAGTAITTATHLITMPYHPEVTTDTQIYFGSHLFYVRDVQDPDFRHVETICICEELVPQPGAAPKGQAADAAQ